MNMLMALSEEQRAKVTLFIRMSLGAGLLGIGYGYYMQVMGRLEMVGWLHFEFAIRGIVIGLFFWGFHIFIISGSMGERLRAMGYGPKVFFKTVAYLVVIETGFVIGDLIFNPGKYLTYFSS
jgi:hypothetical protein